MKFQPDTLAGTNAITRLDGQRLWVGSAAHGASVLVPWRGPVLAWPPNAAAELAAAHFEAILALQPELVVYGSGPRLVFPPPALARVLFERRIGLETMDTAAACRTYNVLASEGRSVVAALILAPT
ncbi:MAG: Mth938-like domain-containing protein [Betaproteobacteria bacterium]|jgi:uncharacterized protein|nr:MTH938/NDUFAF3 family protein [Rubrivivax sp.]